MATIITKNSSTASAVPLAGDLVKGELAVNVTDKKLYTKDNGGSVVVVGQEPLISGTNIKTVNSNSLLGSGNVSVGDVTLTDTQTLTNKTIQAGTFTNTSLFSGTMSSTANAYQEIDTLTDGTTITPDFSVGNNFSVTLGGNRTLANPTNLTAGQSGVIFITQDGTGGRTLAFGSYWDFPNAAAPSLTTTASAVDVLVYSVRSATSIAAQLITNIG